MEYGNLSLELLNESFISLTNKSTKESLFNILLIKFTWFYGILRDVYNKFA